MHPLGLRGERRGRVEQPPRRQVLAATPEIASGEQQPASIGRGRREGREQRPVLVVESARPKRELAGRQLAHAVGQQRIVAARLRATTLGEPEHEHRVEIVTDRRAERAVDDALAEAPGATAHHVELAGERPSERRRGGTRLDVVEGGQATQGIFDPGEGVLLGHRPSAQRIWSAEQVDQQLDGGVGLGPPGGGGVDRVDAGGETVHEPIELVEVVTFAGATNDRFVVGLAGIAPLVEARVEHRPPQRQLGRPVIEPLHHAGLPRQTLPHRGACVAVARAHRCAGDQRHHLVASPSVRWQLEGGEQRAPGHAVGQALAAGSVGGDVGRGELLLEDADIGVGGGMEHTDAIEAHALFGEGGDPAHHGAHLFVGVGDRNDLGAVGRPVGGDCTWIDLEPDSGAGVEHGPVGCLVTGDAHHGPRRGHRDHRGQQFGQRRGDRRR